MLSQTELSSINSHALRHSNPNPSDSTASANPQSAERLPFTETSTNCNSNGIYSQSDAATDAVINSLVRKSIVKEPLYTCPVCSFKYHHLGDLRRHQRNKKHENPSQFHHSTTSATQKVTEKRQKLVATWGCEFCDLSYVHLSDLRRHQRDKHLTNLLSMSSQSVPPNVVNPGNLRALFSNLNKSLQSEDPSSSSQPTTQGSSAVSTNLRRGNKVATHVCEMCGLAYVNRYDLRRHQRRKHQEFKQEPTVNQPTSTSATTTAGQSQQLASHPPHSSSSSSSPHVVNSHLGDNAKHCCRICGLRYMRSSDLRRHFKNKHENDTAKSTASSPTKNTNPQFTASASVPMSSTPWMNSTSQVQNLTTNNNNNQQHSTSTPSTTNSNTNMHMTSHATANPVTAMCPPSSLAAATALCMCSICGMHFANYDELCVHHLHAHPFRTASSGLSPWDCWPMMPCGNALEQGGGLADMNFWPSSINHFFPPSISQQQTQQQQQNSSDPANLMRNYNNLQSAALSQQSRQTGVSVGALTNHAREQITCQMASQTSQNSNNNNNNNTNTTTVSGNSHFHMNSSVPPTTGQQQQPGNNRFPTNERQNGNPPLTSYPPLGNTSAAAAAAGGVSVTASGGNNNSGKTPIGTHICTWCGLRYVYAGDLRRHERRKHPLLVEKRKNGTALNASNEKGFSSVAGGPSSSAVSAATRPSGRQLGMHVCHLCGLRYMRSGDLRRHEAKKHQLRTRHSHTVLGTQSAASSGLVNKPVKEEGETFSFTCELCSMGFRTMEVLRFHQMCLHPDLPLSSALQTPAASGDTVDFILAPPVANGIMAGATSTPLQGSSMMPPHPQGTTPGVTPSTLRGRHKVPATHECGLCGLLYVHRSDLRRHQRLKHKILT